VKREGGRRYTQGTRETENSKTKKNKLVKLDGKWRGIGRGNLNKGGGEKGKEPKASTGCPDRRCKFDESVGRAGWNRQIIILRERERGKGGNSMCSFCSRSSVGPRKRVHTRLEGGPINRGPSFC